MAAATLPSFAQSEGNVGGARFGASVVASDLTVFAIETRGIWVGSDGDLVVTMAGDGGVLTIPSVKGGTFLPIHVTQVRAATTIAAGEIVAFW